MDCAAGDGPPPPELRLAWQCERWKTLPDAGGLYDQDYKTLTRMSALSNVYNAIMHIKQPGGEKTLSESERKILSVLVDYGMIFS